MPSQANGYSRSNTVEPRARDRGYAVEAVAAGDDAAAQLVLLAVVAVADHGAVGVDVDDRHVDGLEHDRVAGGEAGGDEVLDDLLLAVHGDRPADELEEVDAVAAALEGQLDAAVGEALAVEPSASPSSRSSSTVGCSSTPARTRCST